MKLHDLVQPGIISVVLVAFLATVLMAAEKRPAQNYMWRFDGGGRFKKIEPPERWKNGINILWKTPVEIGGYSSPIVVHDRIFATAEMGSLICLDLATGKILWQKDLFNKGSPDIPAELSSLLMRGCGGDSKQSTPTPTSNGELVFYINAMGLCVCYDLHGNRKWIRIIETAKQEEFFSASPIFVGDRIILHWGCLMALDAKDGRTLWKAADAYPTYGTPALTKIGEVEVAVTPAGDIVRLKDGEILCAGLFESTYTTPQIENNVLYVIDRQSMAFELPAQAEKGMRPKQLWRKRIGSGVFMASPVYRNGLFYTIESKRCRLFTIDAKTGEVLTVSHSIDKETQLEQVETGVKLNGLASAKFAYASPVATQRHVYLFDDAGSTAIVKLGRNFELSHVNHIDDAIVGTPYFIDDKIVIRGSKTIYCIGNKNAD